MQREAALAYGDELRAEELDRAPEVKLGPAASAIERREQQAAWYEDRDYVPVTVRGAAVQAARQERLLLAELRARVELAREDGADRVTAGLAALRAAAQRHGIRREHERDAGEIKPEHAREHAVEVGSIRERLARIVDREAKHEAKVGRETGQEHSPEGIRERLGRILGRELEQAEPETGGSALEEEARSIREGLQKVLLARDKPIVRDEPVQERRELEHGHEDRGPAHDL